MVTKNGKTVLLIGAMDVKSDEYGYVKTLLEDAGLKTVIMNFGTYKSQSNLQSDIHGRDIALAGGVPIDEIREKKDPALAMRVMCDGVRELTPKVFSKGTFDGILGMGGSGGTSIISAAMQTLPIGVPKVLVSTIASGNTSAYVGLKDITMIPSIVDVAGINKISKIIYRQAAGAMIGMLDIGLEETSDDKPIIAASMFGQTTPCVTRCAEKLKNDGYEVLIFHGSGTGGKTMETMVNDGLIAGVLDITTTEWADELVGGVFAAGPDRLDGPGKFNLPHLIVPGCIEMVNFGAPETVPKKFKDRTFYQSKPTVTLMRTSINENKKMGEIFAEKINKAPQNKAVLIPTKGWSVVGAADGPFHNPEADKAFLDILKANLDSSVPVYEEDMHINDDSFSDKALQLFAELMKKAS